MHSGASGSTLPWTRACSARPWRPQTTSSAPDDPSAAVVTVEPQSGAIRALAGREGSFNLPLDARRQPGSSFKPIVLAAALREKISPESTYVSKELSFTFQERDYVVANYESVERGEISVAVAMAESDNTVFVQLAADVGLQNVVETAETLGITTPVEPYPSTAIGGLGVDVSPLDMASAYSTFAGGGIHREPYSVERVERVSYGECETAYDHRIGGRRVLTGYQSAVATGVLRRVVKSGTASMLHDLEEEIGRTSAGKTGTTDDFVDTWYVGYTPASAPPCGSATRGSAIAGGCPRPRGAQRGDPAHGHLVRLHGPGNGRRSRVGLPAGRRERTRNLRSRRRRGTLSPRTASARHRPRVTATSGVLQFWLTG